MNCRYIFNRVVNGAVFLLLCKEFGGFAEFKGIPIRDLLLCFAIGILINTIASLFLDPIFKIARVLPNISYKLFSDAASVDERIAMLGSERDLYRDFIVCFMLLTACNEPLSYQLIMSALALLSTLRMHQVDYYFNQRIDEHYDLGGLSC